MSIIEDSDILRKFQAKGIPLTVMLVDGIAKYRLSGVFDENAKIEVTHYIIANVCLSNICNKGEKIMGKYFLLLMVATAMSFANASVKVSECVIQEVIPPKHMTGAFMKLSNDGEETIHLVGASIPTITNDVELHMMAVVDDVMMMQEIPSYELTSGEHEFKKGGYHLMLMNIDHNPEVGTTHTIELTLDNGETGQL